MKSLKPSYKNKESYIEYHFLHSSHSHIFEKKISSLKIQKVFLKLSERFGENNHSIQEYSLYNHEDMELTLYLDGSNFCNKKKSITVEDPYIKNKNICSLFVEKNKIHNDTFPSLYDNTVYDIIDIVFKLQNGISLVIQTKKVDTIQKVESIDKLGISKNTNGNTWCEVFLKVNCESEVSKVHSEIDYIYSLL